MAAREVVEVKMQKRAEVAPKQKAFPAVNVDVNANYKHFFLDRTILWTTATP